MNILVIGSGAVGGFVGSRLIENGADVTFLVGDRRKVHLLTRGLCLSSPFGRFRRVVTAITSDEIKNTFDIVIVAVRAQEYDRAIELTASAVGPSTAIIPIIEGVAPLLPRTTDGLPVTIPTVLEARVSIDADGILFQRPPHAELHVGAAHDRHAATIAELSHLLAGRGLRVIQSDRIRSVAWERFAFVASAIALSVLTDRPPRDAVRFPYGPDIFRRLLKEATRIGEATGFAPDPTRVRGYGRAMFLDGRPVQPPPLIADAGRGGNEAGYLLAELIALGRRARVPTFEFAKAWEIATKPAEPSASRRGIDAVIR